MTNRATPARILVVEDEAMLAMVLETMLTDFGCAVVLAAKIDQALAMIETAGALDAAVLDVNLKGQKSYPVADALVARGVPFAFTTGYEKDSLQNGYRSFPVLQKPFRQQELGHMLTKLLMPEERGALLSSDG